MLIPESGAYPNERRMLTNISLFGLPTVFGFILHIHGTPRRPNSRFRIEYRVDGDAMILTGELTEAQTAKIRDERGDGYDLRYDGVLELG